MAEKPKIGFIGQGFIGKSYADDFEKRGYDVVRYGLQSEYVGNKEKIAECDIVLIAVNAATVPTGDKRDDGHPRVRFDDSNLRSTPALTRPGAIVVIKSTMPPGTTASIQEQYPDRIILHSPEFLLETTAVTDASHPERNIVGMAKDTPEHRAAAELFISLLPKAPYELITDSKTAELIKYGNNSYLFTKIVFSNIFYELVAKHGAKWETVAEVIGKDPRIGPSHMDLHLKDDPEGVYKRRGAGRSCFIKDWAELSELFAATFPEDTSTIAALRGFEYKNAELLREYDRYVNLLEGVYGPDAGKNNMQYEDFAIKAVTKAGELLMNLRTEKFETGSKGDNPRDIVTSVDTAVNDFLVAEVTKAFPEHGIYSEESTGAETASRYEWTIDPIDGSSNFSRGIPHFAVCLGVLEDGMPIAGAIYNPVTRELFSFTKGSGARLNGSPIHVSSVASLSRAQVIFSGGSRNPQLWDWAAASYRKLLEHALKRGTYNSSALDLCFVAAGRADVAVYGTLSTLDVACAFGVLYEAGGVASDAQGNLVTLSREPQKVFIANNKTLLTQVRELVEA